MDESDATLPTAKKIKPTPPPCSYGAVCYRKNPQHFKQFSHPAGTPIPNDDEGSDQEAVVPPLKPAPTPKPAAQPLPLCKYGFACTRTNPQHFKKYSHPTVKVRPE